MPKTKTAKPKVTGSEWRRKTGRKSVWLTLDPADWEILYDAAHSERLPLSEFCRRVVMDAARKSLSGNGK